MGSTAVAAHEYWGYLIKPDKNPTAVFEQLLYGIANYIKHQVAPWDTNCLTPEKLATFYRLVGGDYDPLFLETSRASLAFIYQSLGCFHTLQPEQDPYAAPTIPALTLQGFVRWQTVQVLLEPEEHVPFLQNAVKRFEITNPVDGLPFPSILPKEALPSLPDPEISDWHSAVSEKLMTEAQSSADRNMPPRPQMALSDNDLDSSADAHSIAGTDLAAHFSESRSSFPSPYHVHCRASFQPSPQFSNEEPWSAERRRNSLFDNNLEYRASWPRNVHVSHPPPRGNTRSHHHQRDISDSSTISTSTSDSSTSTTSSASLSPIRYDNRLHHTQSAGARSHTTHLPSPRSASHPQTRLSPQRERFSHPSGAKNVRWQDMDDIFDGPRYQSHRDGRRGRNVDYAYGKERAEDRARGRSARNPEFDTYDRGRGYPDRERW